MTLSARSSKLSLSAPLLCAALLSPSLERHAAAAAGRRLLPLPYRSTPTWAQAHMATASRMVVAIACLSQFTSKRVTCIFWESEKRSHNSNTFCSLRLAAERTQTLRRKNACHPLHASALLQAFERGRNQLCRRFPFIARPPCFAHRELKQQDKRAATRTADRAQLLLSIDLSRRSGATPTHR